MNMTSNLVRCPRCSTRYDRRHPAMSRATADSDIEICAPCGSDEAAGRGVITMAEWPIGRQMEFHSVEPGDSQALRIDRQDFEQIVVLSIGSPGYTKAEILLDAQQVTRIREALDAVLDQIIGEVEQAVGR